MRILYVFPHPDDESFGPARAMAVQRHQGHEVYLLTLTHGEATKVRHKLGWTLEQMGEARYRELWVELLQSAIGQVQDPDVGEIEPVIAECAFTLRRLS